MRLPYAPPLWAGIVGLVTFFADISVAGTLLPFFVDDVHLVGGRAEDRRRAIDRISQTLGVGVGRHVRSPLSLRRGLCSKSKNWRQVTDTAQKIFTGLASRQSRGAEGFRVVTWRRS